MTKVLGLYAIVFIVMMLIDFLWLGFVAQKLYKTYLGFLMADSFQLLPGIVFYLLYAAGVLVFVVQPLLKDGNIAAALLRGAFFGLVCYATYDLTNWATIKNWPPVITFIDLAWGSSLTAVVSATTIWLARMLKLG